MSLFVRLSKLFLDLGGLAGALAQIEDRNYTEALRDYRGNLLLVGINYNRKSKKHSCIIRKMEKE